MALEINSDLTSEVNSTLSKTLAGQDCKISQNIEYDNQVILELKQDDKKSGVFRTYLNLLD